MDVRSKKDKPGTICTAYMCGIIGQKAVELDKNNSRWRHFYALALSLFASRNPIYVHQVIVETRKALFLCRPEQFQLKKNLKELLSNEEALEKRI